MYSIGEVSERQRYVFTVARSPVNLKVITSLKIESSTCVRFIVLRGSRVTCSALPISERRQIAFLTALTILHQKVISWNGGIDRLYDAFKLEVQLSVCNLDEPILLKDRKLMCEQHQ